MPIHPDVVRKLDGRIVDIVPASGVPKRKGMFRVTEKPGAPLPLVEIIYVRGEATVCEEIPRPMLPAIVATEREGMFTYWVQT